MLMSRTSRPQGVDCGQHSGPVKERIGNNRSSYTTVTHCGAMALIFLGQRIRKNCL